MRVVSPQALATFMPPPGMLRSQTTRSGLCSAMAAMASSASAASATTLKFEPSSERRPDRQMAWSSARTSGPGRVRSWAQGTTRPAGTWSRTSVPRPGFGSTSTEPPTSTIRPRIELRQADSLGRSRLEATCRRP